MERIKKVLNIPKILYTILLKISKLCANYNSEKLSGWIFSGSVLIVDLRVIY